MGPAMNQIRGVSSRAYGSKGLRPVSRLRHCEEPQVARQSSPEASVRETPRAARFERLLRRLAPRNDGGLGPVESFATSS